MNTSSHCPYRQSTLLQQALAPDKMRIAFLLGAGCPARYILCALEYQLNGHDHDFESDSISVEHILPQHPASGWSAFGEEEADVMVYRLGNMTLLNKGQNRDLGNSEFIIKKSVLAVSNF